MNQLTEDILVTMLICVIAIPFFVLFDIPTVFAGGYFSGMLAATIIHSPTNN